MCTNGDLGDSSALRRRVICGGIGMSEKNKTGSTLFTILFVLCFVCYKFVYIPAQNNHVTFFEQLSSIVSSDKVKVKKFIDSMDAATDDFFYSYNTMVEKFNDPNATLGECVVVSQKFNQEMINAERKVSNVKIPPGVSKEAKAKMEQIKANYESAFMLMHAVKDTGTAMGINGQITEKDLLNINVAGDAAEKELQQAIERTEALEKEYSIK